MPDVRLIDANVVVSYIDDCIEESREEREDAKSRGNDCEVNYNAGEIQMARRIKRQINLGTPTIDAVPVVHARWVRAAGKSNIWYCSVCGDKINYKQNRRTYNIPKVPVEQKNKLCRNCGAKMDGGAEG